MPTIKQLQLELSTGRIENLVDGVFAIAMTVLVLNLDVSNVIAPGESISLRDALLRMNHRLQHYLESFIILAAFWVKHHQQYHFIRRSDRMMLWINLAGLFFVSLIPFSTDLVGDFSSSRLATFIFEGNMLLAGLVYFWHWAYATHRHRLVDRDLDERIIRVYRRGNMVVPAVAAIALIISIIDPRLGTLMFISVPFLLVLARSF